MTRTAIDDGILSLLGHAVGHRNAVSRKALQIATGLSERAVKQSIERLKARGEKIGCIRSEGGGYFLMVTAEDVAIGEAPYRKQALTMLRRLRQSMTPAERLEFAGQARMALVGGDE